MIMHAEQRMDTKDRHREPSGRAAWYRAAS